jgi:TRAP transporter TAXI family solute receptor
MPAQVFARTVALAAALAAALVPQAGPAAGFTLFSLGSGGIDGGYYAVARAICDRVNRVEPGALRCSPEPSAGSLYNIEALRDEQLDFALVQSDLHRHAFEGVEGYAATGPMTDLRSVLSLYPETVTILARRGAGITGIADLRGRRFDIGEPGSGRRATAAVIGARLGLGANDLDAAFEFSTSGALEELCAGDIDAMVLVTGHPVAAVARALGECDAVLVPLAEAEIETLVEQGDYVRSFIPLAAYPTLSADVPSVAVIATLVTRADIDEAVVATVVSTVLADRERLGLQSRLLATLDPFAMESAALSAPLHPGAAAAFASAGE